MSKFLPPKITIPLLSSIFLASCGSPPSEENKPYASYIQSENSKEILVQKALETGGMYYLCDTQEHIANFIVADDYDKYCHTGSCSSYRAYEPKIFISSSPSSEFPKIIDELCKRTYVGRYTLYKVSNENIKLDAPENSTDPKIARFDDPYSQEYACLVNVDSEYERLDGVCLKL